MQRVLLVRRGYVGDIIQTTALLSDLRAAFPEAKIVYMTGAAGAEVLQGNPCVDEVIPYLERPGLSLRALREARGLVSRLRRQRFDLGVALSHNSWDSVILGLAGAKRTAGFVEPGREFLLDQAVIWDERQIRPGQEYYDDLLRVLGIEPRCRRYTFATDAGRGEWSGGPRDEGRPLLVVAPGGGRHPAGCAPYRQWPAERFAQVIEHFVTGLGWQACLIGDAGDSEVAGRVLAALPASISDEVTDLTARTTLAELGGLLARADLLIANDSAPVWIAAAVGCPAVAIFGCNHPENHRPLAAAYAAVCSGLPCHPCFSGAEVPACAAPPPCLLSVEVAEVLEAARAAAVGPETREVHQTGG